MSRSKIWDGSKWVDMVGAYLPLTGGTMTGTITMAVDSASITLKDSSGSNGYKMYANVTATADYGWGIRDLGNKTLLAVRDGFQATITGGADLKGGRLSGVSEFIGTFSIAETGSSTMAESRIISRANGTFIAQYVPSNGRLYIGSWGGSPTTSKAKGIFMRPVFDNHAGGAANVVVDGNGLIQRSSSARKYKSRIKPIAATALADTPLNPVEFRYQDGRDFVGFIADDLAAQDERLCEFSLEGEVENYDVRAVVAILAAKSNRMEVQIAELAKG